MSSFPPFLGSLSNKMVIFMKMLIAILLVSFVSACSPIKTPVSARFSNNFVQEYTIGKQGQRQVKSTPAPIIIQTPAPKVVIIYPEAEREERIVAEEMDLIVLPEPARAARPLPRPTVKRIKHPKRNVKRAVKRLTHRTEDKKTIGIKVDPTVKKLNRVASVVSTANTIRTVHKVFNDTDMKTIAELLD